MPTCQCQGGTCVCNAIQVPPKLPFWKKHDRRVHGFVAWMAVLNMALVASLPIAMRAAEPGPTGSATSPPVTSGVDSCVQRCEQERHRCATSPTSASGTAENPETACNAHAKDCYALCAIAPKLGLPALDTSHLHTDSASSSQALKAKREALMKLEIAKKRISGFARNLASIKQKIAQLEKSGMQAPAGLEDAVAQGDALVASLKSVTSPDDLAKLGDVQSAMENIASALKQGLAGLEKQKYDARKFAGLDKQLSQLDRVYASAQKYTASSSNTELIQKVSDLGTAISNLKTAVLQAHDAIVAGDIDGGSKILESQIPALVDAVKQAMLALRTRK